MDLQTISLLGALLLLTIGMLVLCYVNAPYVEFGPDTPGYLGALHQLQTTGNPVNYFRLPTYPMFLLVIYALTFQGNLMAVSIVQGLLFLCAVGEIFLLSLIITRKNWIAFLVGALVGTNIFLLDNVKLIMTEGISLWLFTTVMLAAILFLKTARIRYFWISAGGLLLLLFTRPEWVLFPVILFPVLFFLMRKHLPVRSILIPMISTLIVIYSLIGIYIYVNAQTNHIASLSSVTNMNLIGKVLQYRMQDESPVNPALSRIYDSYLRQGIGSPYSITAQAPGLNANNAQASADWAKGIILHHPGEFLVKSVPYLFTSLYFYPFSSIPYRHGPFGPLLNVLLRGQIHLSLINLLFPICALVWLFLFARRKARQDFSVQAMGIVVLTSLYALLITTLGGYTNNDYVRVHVVFDPVLTLIIWGSLGLLLASLPFFRKKSFLQAAPNDPA